MTTPGANWGAKRALRATGLRATGLGLAMATGLAAQVPAQEGMPDVNCDAPQYQMEMTYCAEQEWLAEDARLNAVWKQAVAMMKRWDADLPTDLRGGEDFLRQGQRAWISYRDATCAAEGFSMRGGTGEPMMVGLCLARITRQRADDLEAFVSSFE